MNFEESLGPEKKNQKLLGTGIFFQLLYLVHNIFLAC